MLLFFDILFGKSHIFNVLRSVEVQNAAGIT